MAMKHYILIIVIAAASARSYGDVVWSDSPTFHLDLLTIQPGGGYDYSDSGVFSAMLYPVHRGWGDSGEFPLETGHTYQTTSISVTAACKYKASTKILTISATAYDRLAGAAVRSGQASYEMPGLSKSGPLTFDGSIWTASVDLAGSPPAPGQYSVTIDIKGGWAVARFNVIAAIGEVLGVVRNAAGAPIPGADVSLYSYSDYYAGRGSMAQDVTADDGVYSFTNLLPGWYVVKVAAAGYASQNASAIVTAAGGDQVDFILAGEGNLSNLKQPMRSLRQKTLDTMSYETGLMSQITGNAVSDLSARLDVWDLVSMVKGFTKGLSSEFFADRAGKYGMETAIKLLMLDVVFTQVVKEGIDGAIQLTAQGLLPDDRDSWKAFTPDELKQIPEGDPLWEQMDTILTEAQTEFENSAGISVAPQFDFQKARVVIISQEHQLARVIDGEPLISVVLPDPDDGAYVLGLPAGSQMWKVNHVMISLAGGVKKAATVIEIGAWTVGAVAGATGVGLPVTGIAGAVVTGARIAGTVSSVAEVSFKVVGAFTYCANAMAWAHDLAALPLSYTGSKDFILKEAASPYYLSSSNSFSANATLDLNTLPGGIIVPLLVFTPLQHADISVTNTSNVAAEFRVAAAGWWDYKLPGDIPWIGGLFGGVTNIHIPTAVGLPITFSLAPGASDSLSVPYMGYFIDPINMFSKHWLKVDVYAGPHLVKSLSKPYYVVKLTPIMMGAAAQKSPNTGVVASFTSDGRSEIMSEDSYQAMMPVMTELAAGTVDANQSTIECIHFVKPEVSSVSYELICDDTAQIALQVYDTLGNCVGYDFTNGGVQNEFLGTYSGNGSGAQSVDIPGSAGQTFTVKAVLQGGAEQGPFDVQLFAFETPVRPAILAVAPESIEKASDWNGAFELSVTVGEAGHQQPLADVNASISELVGPEPGAVLPVYTATKVEVGDIAAGSAKGVGFQILVPLGVPIGDYAGQITVASTNAGSVTIPVLIHVDDRPQDLSEDGIINFNDFAVFAEQWSLPGQSSADFNADGKVDANDLADLADHWLWEAGWYSH